jgi:DNA-binding NtrC family response regulator
MYKIRSAQQVLVVDDDADTREILEEMLTRHGYSVWLSGSSLAGIAALESKESFDAVIVDYRMPLMNGIEFLNHVKHKAGCPVIMLTGYGSSQVRREAKLAGAAAFAEKPIDPRFLQELIESAIDEHRKSA